ncbi:MAG TPA: IS1380 family transposase, partial [Tepidisphaeraceae bacterium]
MRQCAIPRDRVVAPVRPLPAIPSRLEASFDAGRLTSDGGLPWVAAAEAELGVCAAFAAGLTDWRRGPVRHPLALLVRQRVFQIACGYADQDDADAQRSDPLLKAVCGRAPATGADLASQPTLSRFENAVDGRACARLADALFALYLRERGRGGVPHRLLRDIDSTDDPTHGGQEGTAYHGHYRQHMYHPLLVFDGDTDHLIAAALRAGNAHASQGVVPLLTALVPALRSQWPGIPIEVRMDGGGAIPALYAFCEQAGLTYTVGLPPNARLTHQAARLVGAAEAERAAAGADKVRLVGETPYQAGGWPRARRVVVKVEATARGTNTRFVVTTRPDPPAALDDRYADRGAAEGWIKDLKNACFADRLSDHRFWANQFRLLLHAAAYWLLDTLRRWLAARAVPRVQLDTL